MILSNEPGYYRTGEYGIRIENLILVTEAAPVADAEKPLNAFETLTFAPIDARLIDQTLLTDDESVLARCLSFARARCGGAGARSRNARLAVRRDRAAADQNEEANRRARA